MHVLYKSAIKRTDVWNGGRPVRQKIVDGNLINAERQQYRHACNSTTIYGNVFHLLTVHQLRLKT